MQTVFLALILAQPLPPGSQLPLPPGTVLADKVKTDYETAREKALATGKPLVVFVGTDEYRAIDDVGPNGGLMCWKDSLKGYPAKCIVVVAPSESLPGPFGGGGPALKHLATLDKDATDEKIRSVVPGSRLHAGLEEPAPRPFSGNQRRTADGDGKAAGPWPERLPFPAGMRRYESARNTQLVFNTKQFRKSPRSELEAKWNVPGHLLGVKGDWRSDLYTNVQDSDVEVFPARLDVWNGGYWMGGFAGGIVYENGQPKKSIQSETSLQRRFKSNATFIDVLSLGGRVFEVREWHKDTDGWHPSWLFKDAAARPEGYVPPRSLNECRACHVQAGTGLYATGLVPGGDTILSYPFSQLE